MIDLMDNKTTGGNKDGFVTQKEFLSYLGTRKEYWDSDDIEVINDYRPWSLLWEHLSYYHLVDLNVFKKNWVIDTRLNVDMFLNDHIFLGIVAFIFVIFLGYIICTGKIGTLCTIFVMNLRHKYEAEYDYKLEDLQ